jgi:hypothetical protein
MNPKDQTSRLPILAGLAEASRILGVSRQRVHQLSKTPEFPIMVARLSMGPIWLRGEIVTYALMRNRMPGPKKQ